MAKKTKKEWIEWFNSIDDDVVIELDVAYLKSSEKRKIKENNYCGIKYMQESLTILSYDTF